MYEVYSLLIGVIGKLYDDIEDLHIDTTPFVKDTLKSLTIMFYALISYNDFAFSLTTFFITLLTRGIDNSFWKSFLIPSFILCIISYFSSNSINYIFLFIAICSMIIVSNIEDKLYPEEYSYKKLITRVIGLIGFIGVLYLYKMDIIKNIIEGYGNFEYIEKIIYICIGGLIISNLSQVYNLIKN
jgi:hypothetical protein